MPLYTFITDYAGGTYCSQVFATDSKTALFSWAKNLNIEAIPGITTKAKLDIIEKIQVAEANDTGHVALDTLDHVWFFSVEVEGHTMFVNFVQTEETQM